MEDNKLKPIVDSLYAVYSELINISILAKDSGAMVSILNRLKTCQEAVISLKPDKEKPDHEHNT